MTSATEELRRLLDERGVEWYEPVQIEGSIFTRWNSGGVSWTASMVHGRDNALRIGASTVTPEQAIAATLGSERGTCHIVRETKTIRSLLHGEVEVTDERCSECRGFMDVGCGVYRNYCPNCGRKVIYGE